jgi:hypothetical protein
MKSNKPSENVTKFKYFGTTVTNRNWINEEIKTDYILETLPTYMLVVLPNYSQYKPAIVARHLWLFCLSLFIWNEWIVYLLTHVWECV